MQDDQTRWKNLQKAKREGTTLRIDNLAHYTKPEAAEQIANTNGFRGGQKKINEIKYPTYRHNFKAKFSWWSPIFSSHDIANVRDHLGGVIQPFIGENDNQQALQNQFATSDAFRPKPDRYGRRLFQYGINDLCHYYQDQVGGDDLSYKILKTFDYKQEVMHAVLVCSQANGTGRFAAYPDVLTSVEDVNNEAVITCDAFGNWIWRPQATATKIRCLRAHQWQRYPMYRRWEHVAFAFHIPDEWEDGMMEVDDPRDHQWEINDVLSISKIQSDPEPVVLP